MYARTSGNGRGQNGANSTGRAGMAAAITPMVKNYQTVGSSSSDGTDWNSLNPNLYQNMSNDQVDWAALAQQWIQMKETLPPELVPAAPPPPVISWNRSPPAAAALETIDEQGEAPMEVEKEDDLGQVAQQQQQSQTQAGTWQNGSVAWQYPTIATSHSTSEWRSSAWETSWSTGSGAGSQSSSGSSVPVVNPQASAAVANWQAKMSRIYKINEGGAGSEPIAGTVQPANSSKQAVDGSKRIPGLMDQVINPNEVDQADQDTGEDTTQTINDAKRKLLPAWIREGLEKMEREKQRTVEREREQKQREQLLEQRRQAELEALSELESAKKKSKFESDSEEEEEAVDGNDREGPSRDASPVPVRSREEILQELMISVRKNLTEILLEVTNEEIAVLAKETLAKTRRKAPTAQALRKTGLATLTGGLGLGIYGDSDDDEEDDDGSGSEKGRDSSDGENEEDDEEVEKALRSAIKQRQKEFEWTAREIEEQLAQEEAREERKRREYEQQQKLLNQDQNSDDEEAYGSGRAGFGHTAAGTAVGGGSVSGGKSGSRDGETQPVNDKIYAHKLGRTRDKRISRFSDPKDTVRQTHITHVAIVPPALNIPKVGQMAPTATMVSSGISPPVVLNPTASAPLFPAAIIGAGSGLESYRHRENSVASEAPSTSSRASSSHRTGHREKTSSSSSRHRSSHKSHKKHKRSRYSRSDDEDGENDCYVTDDRDDDRYSQYSSSRRSRSSERSSHSRRHRRSYSRDSRDDSRRGGSRRSRSPRDRYRSSRKSRSRSRSPLSRRGRY